MPSTRPSPLSDAEWQSLIQLTYLIEIWGATVDDLRDHPGVAALAKAVEAGLIRFLDDVESTNTRGR